MTMEEALVQHCAPTLAGLKAANLFRYLPDPADEPARLFAGWDQRMAQRGIRIRTLKQYGNSGAYLVYVYREAALRQILREKAVQNFLSAYGYTITPDCNRMLQQLANRLYSEQGFPHEIGVFLGYPLFDTVGFIRNAGKNYRYSGCWKVYGDPAEAKRRFTQFEVCTRIYRNRFQNGCPVVQLAAQSANYERTERKTEHEENCSGLLERNWQHGTYGAAGCGRH